MIDPEPPTLPSDEDYERSAGALRGLSEDKRVNDFIKRLRNER
jgi:hypothetical protein